MWRGIVLLILYCLWKFCLSLVQNWNWSCWMWKIFSFWPSFESSVRSDIRGTSNIPRYNPYFALTLLAGPGSEALGSNLGLDMSVQHTDETTSGPNYLFVDKFMAKTGNSDRSIIATQTRVDLFSSAFVRATWDFAIAESAQRTAIRARGRNSCLQISKAGLSNFF